MVSINCHFREMIYVKMAKFSYCVKKRKRADKVNLDCGDMHSVRTVVIVKHQHQVWWFSSVWDPKSRQAWPKQQTQEWNNKQSLMYGTPYFYVLWNFTACSQTVKDKNKWCTWHNNNTATLADSWYSWCITEWLSGLIITDWLIWNDQYWPHINLICWFGA